MSIAYYLVPNDPVCPHCGRAEEPLRVAVLHRDYKVRFHAYSDRGLKTLEDWAEFLKASADTHELQDEFGTLIPTADFLRTVEGYPNINPSAPSVSLQLVASGLNWESFEGADWF